MTDGLSNPEAEYAKDPNIKKEDILALMEWASKQAHLPQITGKLILVCYISTYVIDNRIF